MRSFLASACVCAFYCHVYFACRQRPTGIGTSYDEAARRQWAEFAANNVEWGGTPFDVNIAALTIDLELFRRVESVSSRFHRVLRLACSRAARVCVVSFVAGT